MSEEETKKMFSRIELDKASDSCGFEFADGYGCTFDNIATCYDDRLKLYDFVKQLQQENQKLKADYGIKAQVERDLLKEQNQKYKEVFDKLNKYIKLLGKYDGEKCTRGFSMMTADFNKLLDILKEVE